jgi:hypothetical protein
MRAPCSSRTKKSPFSNPALIVAIVKGCEVEIGDAEVSIVMKCRQSLLDFCLYSSILIPSFQQVTFFHQRTFAVLFFSI